MQQRYLVSIAAILLAFSIGLVGFFIVSNGLPDGLDRTMEEHGAPESEPIYNAPLTYGEDYMTSLLMGAVGFFITLLAVLGLVKLRRSARSPEDK